MCNVDLLWKSRFFGLPIVLISNYFDKITSAVLTHVGCNRMCNKFGLGMLFFIYFL